MVFEGLPIVVLGLALVVLWLAFLSIWVYKIARHYARLTEGVRQGGLDKVLGKLLDAHGKLGGDVKELKAALAGLDKRTLGHVQKIGLVRFNPFQETGGDQSFALALLDGFDSGVVVLSLHGREGTRVYVKEVVRGKARYQLSREEEGAIEEAKKS